MLLLLLTFLVCMVYFSDYVAILLKVNRKKTVIKSGDDNYINVGPIYI